MLDHCERGCIDLPTRIWTRIEELLGYHKEQGCSDGDPFDCLKFVVKNGVCTTRDYVAYKPHGLRRLDIILDEKRMKFMLLHIDSILRDDNVSQKAIEDYLIRSPVVTVVKCGLTATDLD